MTIFEPPVPTIPEPVEAAEGRTWNRIIDFRAGIHDDVAPSRPPGHLQRDGTFQCYANAAGSLIPAPRLVERIYRDPSDYTSTTLTNEQFRISGLFANGPVYAINPDNRNTTGTEESHVELFVAVEYWTGSDADNSTLNLDVSRYTLNQSNPAWESVWSRAYTPGEYDEVVRPRNCVFASQRSNSSDTLKSGPQIVGWVFSGNARYFPVETDVPATTVSNTAPYPGDLVGNPLGGGLVSPTWLTTHQGRNIIFPLYITGDGADQVYVSSECAYWTPVNDATQMDPFLNGNAFYILGGYEHASGYGVFASLTADELFLVKTRGGAIMVRGDVNSPTVRTLPRVKSTGLAFNNGAISHLGYTYPVDGSGVWLWTGGDTAEHITKHLAPDFWRPPALAPAYDSTTTPTATGWGYANTQSTDWNEFVFYPNNWFWDTDEKGWWRILDPDVVAIHRWAADVRGIRVFGTPSGFNTGSDPVVYSFDQGSCATYYSARTHPQTTTIQNEMTVEQIVVCAQGRGKVRVTVESYEHPEPQIVAEVQVDDTARPQMIRQNGKATGTGLVFRIESIGEDHDETAGSFDPNATTDAPTVHWVDYLTVPANQLPNT